LTFWRSEFSQNPSIGPDKFEKQYAYNIRHNYGQVKKQTKQTLNKTKIDNKQT